MMKGTFHHTRRTLNLCVPKKHKVYNIAIVKFFLRFILKRCLLDTKYMSRPKGHEKYLSVRYTVSGDNETLLFRMIGKALFAANGF